MQNRVKAYREHLRWSQVELSQKIGVSRQTIIAIERGKFDPSLRVAFRLAHVLSVPIDVLFSPESLPKKSSNSSQR